MSQGLYTVRIHLLDIFFVRYTSSLVILPLFHNLPRLVLEDQLETAVRKALLQRISERCFILDLLRGGISATCVVAACRVVAAADIVSAATAVAPRIVYAILVTWAHLQFLPRFYGHSHLISRVCIVIEKFDSGYTRPLGTDLHTIRSPFSRRRNRPV